MDQEQQPDLDDSQKRKKLVSRETDHKNQKLPERSDRTPMELHFERVPNIFLGRDRNQKIRTARQTFKKDDGSHGSMEFSIIPSSRAGDLTPDTRKAFVAIQRMIADRLAKHDTDLPLPTRFDFKLREFARYLHPEKSRVNSWSPSILAGIKRHIRKLQQVNFEIHGDWWDAKTQTLHKVEDGFSIVSHYHIAEARKYRDGLEQPPLEIGYIDILPMLVKNVASGYTSPILADVQNSLRSKFARILYQHIDNRYAGVPKQSVYRRLLSKLFEIDFPELKEKYPYPADRTRVVKRACKELSGKPITTGTITSANVIRNKDGSDWLLEIRRKPNPKKESQEVEETEDLGAILISAPSKDQSPGYGEWLRDSPANSSEQVGDIIDRSIHRARQDQHPDQVEIYVQEIISRTGDKESSRNYRAILLDQKAFSTPEIAMTIIRKWLSEISQLEHDGIDGSTGRKLQILYNQHCKGKGIEPYHQRNHPNVSHA